MNRGRRSAFRLPEHAQGDHTRCLPDGCLSAREARVQELVGQALTPVQIGQRLGVTAPVIRKTMRRGRREGWL